eukprot:jgi/Mesvir1/23928/Mv10703-RA.1
MMKSPDAGLKSPVKTRRKSAVGKSVAVVAADIDTPQTPDAAAAMVTVETVTAETATRRSVRLKERKTKDINEIGSPMMSPAGRKRAAHAYNELEQKPAEVRVGWLVPAVLCFLMSIYFCICLHYEIVEDHNNMLTPDLDWEGAMHLAMWPAMAGLLFLAAASSRFRKPLLILSMLSLLPSLVHVWQGDFEPVIFVFHMISSIHFHWLQDVDDPFAAHRTHEVLSFLDFFWVHLNCVSCFIYLAGLTDRRLRALIYLGSTYALMYALFKNRVKKLAYSAAAIAVGGLLLLVVRSAKYGVPDLDWKFLGMGFALVAIAMVFFFVLQRQDVGHYWLHHSLWHLIGNAGIILVLKTRKNPFVEQCEYNTGRVCAVL